MSFFIRKKGRKTTGKVAVKLPKKGRPQKRVNGETHDEFPKKKSRKSALDDVEISSDSEYEEEKEMFESEEEEETAQEKNLRLARKYLDQIKEEEQSKQESEDIDKAAIAHRLREDILEQAGRLKKLVADKYEGPDLKNMKVLRCKEQQSPVTCLVISPDNKFIYTGSKGCEIIKWSLDEGKRIKSTLPKKNRSEKLKNGPCKSATLCLAVSSDNKFLVSGDQDSLIHVWNPQSLDHVHTFKGHRGAVSGLAFRKGTHQLFSCSFDRSVKVWSLDEMGYVETLFGHQDTITAIDALSRERAITSGGRDCTIRVWKIVEESQLIYHGHWGSIDSVKLVSEENFLTCGDDGTVSLWSVGKKKPLGSAHKAHGINPENSLPFWISSIAAYQNTDLVASGSQDGHIRIWKCGPHFKSLIPLFTIPACGFVNSMAFTSDGQHLVAGIGQEHRSGRWWRIKEARNGVIVVPLLRKKEPVDNKQ